MDKRYLCVITAGSMLWLSVGCDGSSSSDGGTPPGTDAGTEADAGMRSDAGTPPDGRDGGGPPSPMTGCTNPNASNYDAACLLYTSDAADE